MYLIADYLNTQLELVCKSNSSFIQMCSIHIPTVIFRVKIVLVRGQSSSLVAHWLLVPGYRTLNPGGGEKFSSPLSFLRHNLMIDFNHQINS